MKKWLQSQNNKSLQIISVLLFSFPLFGLKIPVIIIVLFGIISFTFYRNLLKNFNFLLTITVLLPILYLIQYFIEPTPESWFIFEKKIALVFVPLIFANLPKQSIKKTLPLYVFATTSTLLIISGLGYLVFNGISETYQAGGLSYGIRSTVESVLFIHPTYLSLIASFSIGILISIVINNRERKVNFLLIIGIIIHLAFVLIMASRIALIGLVILLLFTGFFYRNQLKTKLTYLFISILIILGSSWIIPSSRERIQELVTTVSTPTQVSINGTNIRESIYHCTVQILEQNWIKGVGTSHLQNYLNTCYYIIESYDIIDGNYNTHNEYLNIWLGTGLLGFIVIIAMIAISFYYAKGNYIHLVFLILFSLYCLTENLLERQIGVLFFSIWFSYFNFYLSPINDQKVS